MTGLNDGWKAGAARSGGMKPGEQMIVPVKDKDGNWLRNITIKRTARPYVYDLCDAYNEGLSPERKARGIRWQVDANEELRLGFPEQFTHALTAVAADNREEERQKWLHRHRFPERYV